jgi:ABC-type transport system substrate-binding protein
MVMSLAACGNNTNNEPASSGDSSSSQSQAENNGSESEGNAASENGEDSASSGTYAWPTLAEVTPDEEKKSTANSDEQYDAIKVAVTSVPSDLSPYTMSNAITNMEIFDTLMEQTGANDFAGRIAKDWYEEDDTHFVVEIYDYVYDSDGNNITASDVAFSFNTYKDSGFARDFNYFVSCEAIEDYKVRFTWTEKMESLTAFASMMTKTYIVSEKAYNEHDFVTDPVGSGPYKLVDYVTSAHATLEARDDYWQTDESLVAPNAHRNVKTIEYDFISDSSMTAIAFENGDTVNVTLSADTLALFEEGGEYADLGQLVCYPDTVSTTILPNMDESSLMSDQNLRLAVFYALDSEAFADALGSDLFYPVVTDAAASIKDYSKEYEIADTYQNTYDPELAATYLSESSYNNETLIIMYEGNKEKEQIAQVMQAYLEVVGIKAELAAWDHDLISSHASNAAEWDIFLASSGDADYTANRLRKVYGADAGYTKGQLNISLYDNDQFQQMLESDNTVSGNSVAATAEILQYIYDNALGMGTAYQVNVMCFSKDIAQFQTKYSTSEVIYGSCEYYLN